MSVHDKVLVVVGAGPGVGASVARRFAADGFAVGLVARNRARLETLATDVRAAGAPATAVATADARDTDAVITALDEIESEIGAATVLCFSPIPDVDLIKPVLETAPAELIESLQLSVAGAAAAVGRVVPAMIERGAGTLLFTTGSAALRPSPARAASAVTTTAVTTYVALLREQLADTGVRVGHTVIVGPIGDADDADDAHDPDDVAADLWTHHDGTAAEPMTALTR